MFDLCCVILFRAYEIEKRLSTADLFRFPNFETVCWYVGKHLLDTFRGEMFNNFHNMHRMSLCEQLECPVFTLCYCDIINVVLFCLKGLRENRRHPATYLVHGAKALNNAFRSWTRKEVGRILFKYFIFTFLHIILSSLPFFCFHTWFISLHNPL